MIVVCDRGKGCSKRDCPARRPYESSLGACQLKCPRVDDYVNLIPVNAEDMEPNMMFKINKGK